VKKKVYLAALAWTLFLLLLVTLFFGSYGILKVASQDLTTTISAATESLSFSLKKDRQSSWNLPAGTFVVPQRLENVECDEIFDDEIAKVSDLKVSLGYECRRDSNTRLEIEGAANLQVTVTPAGELSVSVTRGINPAIEARLVDESDEVLFETVSEIRFASQLIGNSQRIRFPLVAASAVIGSHLNYAVTVDGSINDLWQPSLLSGNVSVIALNLPDSEIYNVLGESLDTGDVIRVGSEAPPPPDGATNLIWGMFTIEKQDVTLSGITNVEQFLIHAVLHTSHRNISVVRFGTKDGHTIKASTWTIISKWPNGQESWVVFMSAILMLTFIVQLSDSFKRKLLIFKGKRKTKKRRKRNGH
jgi:hypothetical protein